jgi:hypothetical protein
MIDPSQDFARDNAAFQKIWIDTMSRMMKAAATFTPDAVPPEVLRQIRNGIFQALTESWNEFLRSPQFQEGMKQWLEEAVAFRKLSNDLMTKVRKEMQAPSRDDIDTVMLAVRHMEARVLDRVEELAREVQKLQAQGVPARPPPAPEPSPPGSAKRKAPRPAAPRGGKGKKT